MPGKRIYFFLLTVVFTTQIGFAQNCVDDYFVNEYIPTTRYNISSTFFSDEGEVMIAGNVLRSYTFSYRSDGWLTKLSSLGTVLWSRHYTSPEFDFIQFDKIAPSGDGNWFVSGSFGTLDTTKSPAPIVITQIGYLMKVDNYGNKLWEKFFDKLGVSLLGVSVSDMLPLKNGDVILAASYYGQNSKIFFMRIDNNGNLKWNSSIGTDSIYVSLSAIKMKELSSGTILISASIFAAPLIIGGIYKSGYYFLTLNPVTGERYWEKSMIADQEIMAKGNIQKIANIAELPNGDLSFISSCADTSYYIFRTSTKVINIRLDKFGALKNIQSYQPSKSPIYASGGVSLPGGEQVICMDNADAPFLMGIDASGNIQWQHSYPKIGRSQEVLEVLASAYGYYFFSFIHNGGSRQFKMIKTDITGNADCVQDEIQFTTKQERLFLYSDAIHMQNILSFDGLKEIIFAYTVPYTINANEECRKTCCTDVSDTAKSIALCNVTSFKLPNNYTATSTGWYNINFTTPKGCDSIVYYYVQFDTKPEVELGDDQCLDGKDSIILKTKEGYFSYQWLGIASPNPQYIVRQPGIYWVSVANSCGTSTDSVHVFDLCNLPIYMPGAFTPNGDRLNDLFRVPAQNQNRLIQLVVYNRFGEKVFETTDKTKGWNGDYKSIPSPSGTYVYIIKMESPDKRILQSKGTVLLLR